MVGWTFSEQSAATISGFFEGFFAPLAFLWLVVGLFIRQTELARTRDEMHRTNVLAAQQAAAIETPPVLPLQQRPPSHRSQEDISSAVRSD